MWDVRTFKPMHAYFANSPATSLDVSQRGILAVGQGRRLQLWRDCLTSKATSPYLTHMCPLGGIRKMRFCPYEDLLGVGTAGGVSSVLVPGAGEPNFDSFVANPYASKQERQEQEVVQLLDKLQPDSITLDPDAVGKVCWPPNSGACVECEWRWLWLWLHDYLYMCVMVCVCICHWPALHATESPLHLFPFRCSTPTLLRLGRPAGATGVEGAS